MSLQINSVSLVTGAGSGIAKVIALTYSVEGARDVVIADLNYKAALQTAQESELIATNPTYRPHAVAVDVTDTESVNYMVTAGSM
ncbi:Short-chain dehydrogenase/reductase SDR [Penicillium griseofulvum]|uniref:Short-chain dehydrogenase/reductase SDR n=1 Tax=Penicillium patulum TaxID=5078 RepID=A0A135LED9_PENPA|nr:Short-chain dehydrogenase/reductase SDR [Penicillium griseofulvum]KXG47333.1 Short-chain dehydrogenase/reductase SDR [Penicillium griseofulvum]